ncbi:MAG: rhodanese-like domain-containing protein [Pyrinomonadaceae bacterium]
MKTILLLCTALVGAAACANTSNQTANVQNTSVTKPEPVKSAPVATPVDNAPRITLADAKKDYDAGSAAIIDVRDETAFNLEHIAGALNITPQTLDANISKLPKGKKLIVYCS